MSAIPPVYRKWTQMARTCTCGRRWAVRQREIEEAITKYVTEEGMDYIEARLRWLRENNITMICCLREVTYYEKNQIYDDTIGALTDITVNKSKSISENSRSGDNSGNIGYEFLFKTRGVQDFDMRQHSMRLVNDSLSDFDKIGVLRQNGMNTMDQSARVIPQFPNYVVRRSDDMPTIIANTPLPPVTELTLQALMN